jgi:hypothetical protein
VLLSKLSGLELKQWLEQLLVSLPLDIALSAWFDLDKQPKKHSPFKTISVSHTDVLILSFSLSFFLSYFLSLFLSLYLFSFVLSFFLSFFLSLSLSLFFSLCLSLSLSLSLPLSLSCYLILFLINVPSLSPTDPHTRFSLYLSLSYSFLFISKPFSLSFLLHHFSLSICPNLSFPNWLFVCFSFLISST